MNERTARTFCAAMILFSALIRLLDCAGFAIEPAQLPAGEVRVWPVQVIRQAPVQKPEEESIPAPEFVFTQADADGIHVGGTCSYTVDKLALLQSENTLNISASEPEVLIVHTHSTEAYSKSEGYEYEQSDPYRTLDENFSVIRIGKEIETVLTDAGIAAIHDTALNDYPVYSGGYDRMLPKIEQYLRQYPSISVVLDVHRDAIENKDGTQCAFTANVNGKDCAQIMLVVGTDEGGLEHPEWKKNLANALKLQAVLNREYPNLCRDLELRCERFNAHVANGAMLAEFGAAGNTLDEAINGANAFAHGLADFLISCGTNMSPETS